MKYLVTGGAGFIGSNFIEYILDKYNNIEVVCLDALTYAGNLENLNEVKNNKKFKFVHGDICNESFIDQLFEAENFDMVINFAAETHVDKSIIEPDIFFTTNVIGVRILLDACKKYNVKRFHQISTDEVYGEISLDNLNYKFDEDSPLKASNPYSASKAAADLLVLSYFKMYNLPVTISRCSNNYGKHQYAEKLIPLTVKNALYHNKAIIHGNGKYVRDWIHVLDHCNAIDLILKFGSVGEIYNVGSNNQKQNLEVVTAILEVLNKSTNIIDYVENRPGQDTKYAIDYNKISSKLGYVPVYKFDEEIINIVEWYKNNLENIIV